MRTEQKIAILGGDTRQLFAAEVLRQKGFSVALYGFAETESFRLPASAETPEEALRDADAVLLPLPYRKGDVLNMPFSPVPMRVDDLIRILPDGIPVFAGKADDRLPAGVMDYNAEEAFQIRNAVPSAEGAIRVAMEQMDRTLCGAVCLVVGAGRIGRHLAVLLRAFGAEVFLSSRKAEDLAKTEALGLHAIRTDAIAGIVGQADVVFNTVPAPVVTREVVGNMRKQTPIIDLASGAGGADAEAAAEAGIRVVHALGLPGKFTPRSAGEAVADTVCRLFENL